jgi:flagellar motor protein MotB
MKRLSRLRKRHLRAPQEGSWAVSYGDMITLLLGFYIMYFSIDPPKKGNTTLTTSLIAALEKLDEDVAVDRNQNKTAAKKTDDPAPSLAQENKPEARDSETGNAVVERITAAENRSDKRGQDKKLAVEADPQSAMQTIMEMLLPKDWVDKLSEHQMSAKQLGSEAQKPFAPGLKTPTQDISKDGAPTGSSASQPKSSAYRLDVTELRALDAEASRIGDRVYIMFPKVSFFASASTEITPEGRQALEKFSKAYLPFAGKALLNIVGFSDERPVKAVYRFRDNLELSVLRAVSAQRVAENIGIPLSRTRLMGHGINTKLVEGEEPSNAMERWALTRKIMLVIEPEVP